MSNPQYSEIELVVHDSSIEVYFRGRHYLSLAIKEESGQLALAWCRDDIEFIEGYLGSGLRALDVYITTLDRPLEGSMALPKYQKEKVDETRPRVIKARRKPKTGSGGNSGPDAIAETDRDKVLNAILDSLLDHPDQDNEFTRAETKRIATKHKVGHMQVAGVRAAFTKGSYGEPERELRRRRRQRAQIQQAK